MPFRCHPGWTGPTCEICIPLPGCSIDHGYCTKPMECKCKEGYKGRFCNAVKCRKVRQYTTKRVDLFYEIFNIKNQVSSQ